MEFSNIDLLRRVNEETSSKKKPVEILILISRILFVCCMVLAFAQPVSKDREDTLMLKDSVLIYLDNSMSMGRPVGTQSNGFDLAYSFASTIIDAYPDNTNFRFIDNAYGNSLVANYSKESIKDRLTELEFSSISRTIEDISQRVSSNNFEGDVYLISDFQKGDSKSLEKLNADTVNNYYLVPIDLGGQGNLYFDSAYLENSFLLGELKNELNVIISNSGKNTVEDVNIRLFFNNRLASTAVIDVPANSSVTHPFEIDRNVKDLDKVKINLEDAGADFDNRFFLTLNNIEKVNVLEIRGASSSRYVAQLYKGNELFNYDSVVTGNVDLNRFTEANIILLNEVESFSNQLILAINNFVTSGGTLVVIPSTAFDQRAYIDLGLRISNDSKQRLELSDPDLTNPFFSGVFEESEQRISMPEATTYFRLRNQELSLLDFKNGRSFLSKANTKGQIYFFSSSFEESMTSFANHSLFVPVMYKLALGSKVNLSRLYYSTDEGAVVYPIDRASSLDIVTLTNDSEELTPDQRFSVSNLIMEMPKDIVKPGHYNIESGDMTIGTVAFNLPKEESESISFSKEELSSLAESSNVNLIEANDSSVIDREITAGIKGIGLWKYALMLALLFLCVEMILIRYL